MKYYELGNEIHGIQQPYLPGLEKREPVKDRRLVLERTIADFWNIDTLHVASLIRELFIVGYNEEENCMLQSAWNWVQEGRMDSNLPIEILLNSNTVFFWTEMKEAFKDPDLGDFPVACKVDTDEWRADIRAVCGECVYKLRTVAAGELHKHAPTSERIGTITRIEEFRGPFQGLTNEAIIRAEQADLVTYSLLVNYYMTLIERGKQLLEIYRRRPSAA